MIVKLCITIRCASNPFFYETNKNETNKNKNENERRGHRGTTFP